MTLFAMFLRLGSANVLSLGAHVVTIGILGVIAPPEQFAIFLLALSAIAPFSASAGLRLESAFPSISGSRELGAMLIMASASAVLISLLQFAVVAVLQSYALFEFDKFDLLSLGVLPLLTLAQALVQIGRLWAIRKGRIRLVARATALRAVTTLAARGLVIGLLTLDEWPSLEGSIGLFLLLGELTVTAVMAANLFPHAALVRQLVRFRLANARAALRRNWTFPALETPSTILDSVAQHAPMFLVAQFFGLGATANFGLAFRGLAVPMAQISRTLTEVMQVRYSEFLRSGEMTKLKTLFRHSTLAMASLGLAALALLAAVYAIGVPRLTSARWQEFAIIVLIISPWIASNAVVNINSRLIVMLKRQDLKLIYDGYSLLAIGILFVCQANVGAGLYTVVGLLSAAQFSSYLLYWLLIRHAIARHAGPADLAASRGPAMR